LFLFNQFPNSNTPPTHPVPGEPLPGRTTNFWERYKQHKKKAAKPPTSKFYSSYPTAGNAASGSQRRGTFEALEMNVAVGFDRSNAQAVKSLCATDSASGIFFWSDTVRAKISAASWKGALLQDKKLRMIGDLLELMYELMIAGEDNVSENPGFEMPLGQWD
jgi:hypothetical protein